MDIISYGLWGGIAFGRTSKKSYTDSLLYVFPDAVFVACLWIGNKWPQLDDS